MPTDRVRELARKWLQTFKVPEKLRSHGGWMSTEDELHKLTTTELCCMLAEFHSAALAESAAIPKHAHITCPACNGIDFDKCEICKGMGYVAAESAAPTRCSCFIPAGCRNVQCPQHGDLPFRTSEAARRKDWLPGKREVEVVQRIAIALAEIGVAFHFDHASMKVSVEHEDGKARRKDWEAGRDAAADFMEHCNERPAPHLGHRLNFPLDIHQAGMAIRALAYPASAQ